MPNLRGLVNDPRFKALTPQQQRETLTRIDKRFGDLDDTQLGEFRSKLTAAQASTVAAPVPAAPAIPQLKEHKSLGGFASNLPSSFATNVKAMGEIAKPSTWQGIAKVAGWEPPADYQNRSLGGKVLGNLQMLNPIAAIRGAGRVAGAVGGGLADKYGSVDKLSDTAYMDPFGVLADASMLLSPTSALKNAGRLGKVASKVGQVADVADVGNLPARAMLTAGNRAMRALPPAPAPKPQKLLTTGSLTEIPGGYMGPIPPGRNPAALPPPPNRTVTPTPPGVRPRPPVPEVPLPAFRQYESPAGSVAGRPYPQADRLDLTNQPPGLGKEIAEESAAKFDLSRGYRITDRRLTPSGQYEPQVTVIPKSRTPLTTNQLLSRANDDFIRYRNRTEDLTATLQSRYGDDFERLATPDELEDLSVYRTLRDEAGDQFDTLQRRLRYERETMAPPDEGVDSGGEKGFITPQMMGDIGGGLSKGLDIPGMAIRKVPGLLGRAAGKLTPQFVKDLPSSTFGVLTGKGPAHIKNLGKGGSRRPELVRHLKGEAPIEELPSTAITKLDEAEKVAGEVRDARWKEIVAAHPEPLDMLGIDKKIQSVLDTGKDRIVRVPPIPEPLPTVGKKAANRADVAKTNKDILRQVKEWNVQYGSQGMKPGDLDMRFSKLDSESEAGVRDMFATLERWKSNPDQWTVEGMDALAARISKKRFPNDSAATGLRKKIVSIIKDEIHSKIPDYQKMNEDYARFGRFRSRVEGEFAIAPKTRAKYGERTTKSTVEKLMAAQDPKNIEGQALLEELDRPGGESLRHMLTGRTMRDIFPSGWARGGAVQSMQGAATHPFQYGITPKLLETAHKFSAILGITSPRGIAQAYRAGSAVKSGAKATGRVVVPKITSPLNYRGVQHLTDRDRKKAEREREED